MSSVLSMLLASASTAVATISPLSPLAAQLRDIHPGPMLVAASDPRIQGWWGLLITLLIAVLIGMTLKNLGRYRRWQRQIDWEAPDLVPRLQTVLREAALRRWPEVRTLQGDAWLAFLDSKGGCCFREFALQWPQWLYGQGAPNARQLKALRRAYLSWGRACIWLPSGMAVLLNRWQQGVRHLRDRRPS